MKRFLKNTIRWVPLCALMVVGFNNCSQFSEMDWGQGQMDNSSLGQTPVETDSEKLGIPIALLSAEQTLQSMIKVTNISTAPIKLLPSINNKIEETIFAINENKVDSSQNIPVYIYIKSNKH